MLYRDVLRHRRRTALAVIEANAFQIIDKINKLKVRIEKKETTLVKNETKLDKLRTKYEKHPDDMLAYDIDDMERTVRTNQNDIEKMYATLDNYKAQLDRIQSAEIQLPECLKELRDVLIEEWNDFDDNRLEELRDGYAQCKEDAEAEAEDNPSMLRSTSSRAMALFAERFGKNAYREMKELSPEKSHPKNEKSADKLVKDLYARVVHITGNVTDWKGVRIGQSKEGPALNGIVTGEDGSAEVKSILAGGHNIQKLHVRVLVNKVR